MPDRSIYKDRKYSPLALIETGRGCNFACDFCAIHSYYEKKYFRRPIEEIVQDIKKFWEEVCFFLLMIILWQIINMRLRFARRLLH